MLINSAVTLNVRGLNTSIKQQKLTELLKFKTQVSFLQEIHFKYKATDTLKIKGCRKRYHASRVKISSNYFNFRQSKFQIKENYQG